MGENEVTYKHLAIGQEIKGVKTGTVRTGFTGYVFAINPSYVTVSMWKKDGRKEKYSTDSIFIIEMTEEEYREKWNKKAGEVVTALQNRMLLDEIGYHSMFNAWVSSNPWEMAEACSRQNYRLLGYCPDIPAKHSLAGDLMDIGFCVETEEEDRIWCHARSSYLEALSRRYERYQDWRKDHTGNINLELAVMPFQIEEEKIKKNLSAGLDIVASNFSDTFKCKCGNTIADDGFQCWEDHAAKGKDLPWKEWNFTIDGYLIYRCNDCGRITIIKDDADMPMVDGKKVICYGADNGSCYYKLTENGAPVYTDQLLTEIQIGAAHKK